MFLLANTYIKIQKKIINKIQYIYKNVVETDLVFEFKTLYPTGRNTHYNLVERKANIISTFNFQPLET